MRQRILSRSIQNASLAALVGLLPHYLCFYLAGSPLWTAAIAESIMAHTPSAQALWLLERFGEWAKPFAITGGLATLGCALWIASLPLLWRSANRTVRVGLVCAGGIGAALLLGRAFEYTSAVGQLSFWLPATLALTLQDPLREPVAAVGDRRGFLAMAGKMALGTVMSGGTVGVALESYIRNRRLARLAQEPRPLEAISAPVDRFYPGLVRPAVTPVPRFYVMSKAAVDPVPDPSSWRLEIEAGGKVIRRFTYAELLSLPRMQRFVTLRCVSNTLQSDLMGTAQWSGVDLRHLIDPATIPASARECAFVGEDGHGDSFPVPYVFSGEPMLALGMNGSTLSRSHGFPVRLLAPRYYGFKSVKWLHSIRFVEQPYFGTWPKTGFTKDPIIHTASHIDRVVAAEGGLLVAGVSFAGIRGVEQVQVRLNGGAWTEVKLDRSLSPFTWTRWVARLPYASEGLVEARARDGQGHWQEDAETPLYPNGVKGPTRKRFAL